MLKVLRKYYRKPKKDGQWPMLHRYVIFGPILEPGTFQTWVLERHAQSPCLKMSLPFLFFFFIYLFIFLKFWHGSNIVEMVDLKKKKKKLKILTSGQPFTVNLVWLKPQNFVCLYSWTKAHSAHTLPPPSHSSAKLLFSSSVLRLASRQPS